MAPQYGHRLMPTILHEEAHRHPSRKYAIITKSNSIVDGFESINFDQVSRAVNYVANWLQNQFEDGQKPEQQTTLAFVGVTDIRYSIVFYAGIQCRYKVFLPSPRNPNPVNTSLLEQTQCTRLVYTSEVSSIAQCLKEARPDLNSKTLPSLREILEAPDSTYIYDLKFEDVYQEAVLILHSSGSTGIPKPVVCTHGTCATYDRRDYPVIPGRKTVIPVTLMDFPGSCVYNMFPPFHLAGCMYNMLLPLFGESINVYGPAFRPPSGALAAEMMKIHKPRAVYLPPVIIEQLSQEPNFAELVGQLSLVIFAGGPLPTAVGDRIAALTRLGQFYGATEVGMIHQLLPAPEDWSWMEFHPREPIELQPVGDGGSYEMVLFADRALKDMSSFQQNYPNLPEWRTKDLFIRHPTKSNLWKFHARRDDILVLSNGHKVNPLPMETMLRGTPGISGALLVGQGRASVALLVELTQNTLASSLAQQQERLWLAVDKSNDLLPAYGQVVRSMIIVADPNKPFKRAAKGTIVRRLTEEIYGDEIKALYAGDAINTTRTTAPLPAKLNFKDVSSLIRSAFGHVSIDGQQIREDDNIFMFGMDSIKTAELLKHLKSRLMELKPEQELRWLSLEVIYRHPSISSLAAMLFTFLSNGQIPSQRDRVIEMQAKIAECVRLLPSNFERQSLPFSHQKKVAVAITGTTGFLGGYLVSALAKNDLVTHIYCLNRSPRAEELFQQRFSLTECSAKLTFLTVDFTSSRLGLSDAKYKPLHQECQLIVHNAWRINFNFHLSGFEDNILGVKTLIDFSAASPWRPRLVFISSVSATGWRDYLAQAVDSAASSSPRVTRIPEGLVDDISTTMDMGYAESKRVVEHVLYAAASPSVIDSGDRNGGLHDASTVPSTIVRLCQVAPERNQTWPENDSWSALLRSCKLMGVVPVDYTDFIDWIHVDQAADVINDIVKDELIQRSAECQNKVNGDANRCRFYNIVNPRVLPWRTYAEILRGWCSGMDDRNEVADGRLIPYSEWVQMLHQIDDASNVDNDARGAGAENDKVTTDEVPATRILRHFDLVLGLGPTHKYDLDALTKISPTMRENVMAIDPNTFKSWLEQLEDDKTQVNGRTG